MVNGTPFADLALARTLERTESRANAAFVEARARLEPDVGAAWCDVAGTYAMYDGRESPLTQTFGFGLFDAIGNGELEALEAFFMERGAPVHHEVSPLADPAALALLATRDYRPIEFTSVLYRTTTPTAAEPTLNPAIIVRRVLPGEADIWAAVAAEGWGETPELAAFVRAFGRISAHSEGTHTFLAELDGEPIAAGSLSISGNAALLAGASTIRRWRGRGAQLALLHERLRFARDRGCTIAAMGAAPGSASQRNAERHGFRIAYTRIKWQLRPGR